MEFYEFRVNLYWSVNDIFKFYKYIGKSITIQKSQKQNINFDYK